MKDRHGLLTQPIGRVLLKMSLPNLIGIITVLGFSLIDTFFISYLGTNALAAISFTFPVTLVITSIAIGIGAGVSTNLGRLIGAGRSGQAKVFLHDALLFTLLIITTIALLGICFMTPIFALLGANEPIQLLIHDYMSLWFLGVPLLVLVMVGNQGLRATGDTHSPAQMMILAAAINAILDPLLIFGLGPFPRLELQGAAIASIVSWVVAFSLLSYLLLIKRKLLHYVPIVRSRLVKNGKKLAHIAQPAALMNLLNPLANGIFMAILARIDHAAVAAFGAGTRIEALLLVVVLALSSSLVPFIAQNLGAGQIQRAKAALLLSLRFIFVFQTLLYIPLFLLVEDIARLFSHDAQVIEWLSFYLLYIPLSYGPLGVVIILATSLNAYHRPMASLVLNIIRLFCTMLPLVIIGGFFYGVEGIIIALPITNTLFGMLSYWLATIISEPRRNKQ